MDTQLDVVRKYLKYSPENGEVIVLNEKGERVRKLLPNENYMIQTSIKGVKIKMKYNKFVFYLHTGKEIKDPLMIFHKDLNPENFQFSNLMVITKQQHTIILESLKNLSGGIKLVPHASDVFSYVLEYKEKGRTKREVISDITVARKRMKKVQLRCAKYLDKFVVTS